MYVYEATSHAHTEGRRDTHCTESRENERITPPAIPNLDSLCPLLYSEAEYRRLLYLARLAVFVGDAGARVCVLVRNEK